MKRILQRYINHGIKEGDDMEMRRRLGMLNIASLLCLTTILIFMVLNIINHHWLLLVNNIVLVILTICLLFLRRLKYFEASLVLFASLFSIYFFVNALLFRNGLDFAIIIMMAVSVLLINKRTARICLLFLQGTLFTAFMFLHKTPTIIPPLPAYRSYATVILLLIILGCLLEYFKSKQIEYLNNLNKANEELRDSNRVKERMLSILSHDFNAPVGSLATTLNLFDDGMLSEAEFREVSAKLRIQLHVLTMSLSEVLHWSKMQITGDTGKLGNIHINELICETLPLFQHSLQEKNIVLQNSIDVSMVIYGYADDLKLIFRNLLSNAIKFSHKDGTIYLHAAHLANKIVVSITDEGIGIKPEVLAALQNGHLQFTSTPGTAKEKGTGLGLMLVQEFLEKNNGTLSITTKPGKGSTFSVTLPSKK